MTILYKMYLVLGDPYGDGHGKSDKILIESNMTKEVIEKAYKASVKLTGIDFDKIANKYQSGFDITQEQLEKLQKYGFNKDLIVDEHLENIMEHYDTDCEKEIFTLFWLDFVKLSLPNLEAKVVEDKIPSIGRSFGYGLYE